MHNNYSLPLLRNNLIAKFDKNKQNSTKLRFTKFRYFRIFSNIHRNLLEHSAESFQALRGIFLNNPHNHLEHSLEFLVKFPGIFLNIPRNDNMITFSGSSKRFPRIVIAFPMFLAFPIFHSSYSCIPGFINNSISLASTRDNGYPLQRMDLVNIENL